MKKFLMFGVLVIVVVIIGVVLVYVDRLAGRGMALPHSYLAYLDRAIPPPSMEVWHRCSEARLQEVFLEASDKGVDIYLPTKHRGDPVFCRETRNFQVQWVECRLDREYHFFQTEGVTEDYHSHQVLSELFRGREDATFVTFRARGERELAPSGWIEWKSGMEGYFIPYTQSSENGGGG